jgi:excisionase family DNA binding protein
VNPLPLIRLLADDPETVDALRGLVEIATSTRRDLLTARTGDDVARVRRLRLLLTALYPTVASDAAQERNDATVSDADPSCSTGAVIASVQEAAEVLDLKPRRVQQLLSAGLLTGEQDGPRRPWRVHLASVHDYLRHRQEPHA